jgi:hypothetical protein
MKAFEITLLSVCLYITPNFFVVSTFRVLSKESRRLALPRNSCCIFVSLAFLCHPFLLSLLLFHYFLFLCLLSYSLFFLTFHLSFYLSCYLFKFSFALLASNFRFTFFLKSGVKKEPKIQKWITHARAYTRALSVSIRYSNCPKFTSLYTAHFKLPAYLHVFITCQENHFITERVNIQRLWRTARSLTLWRLNAFLITYIRIQFVPHRKHVTYPLQTQTC